MPLEEFEYVRYADRFGWTPDQVDDLPLTLVPWLLPLHDDLQEVRQAQK